MDRTVAGGEGSRWGYFFFVSFSTPFHLHNRAIQLAIALNMLWCSSIHLLDSFYSNIGFSLDHVLVAKLIMLHGIVVGLHHTILDHVLLVKLITLHAIEVGLRHTHTIPCDTVSYTHLRAHETS